MSRVNSIATLVALLLIMYPRAAHASSEEVFKKSVARLKPVEVVSGAQLEQALRQYPGKSLQLSGVIRGLMVSGDKKTIVLRMIDEGTVEIECLGNHPEVQSGGRIRCLVKPAGTSASPRLDLVDITWDRTPIEVIQEAARAALKLPVTDPAEIARSAEELQRTAPMAPSRGGDPSLICKRAITYLNPRLTGQQVSLIADNILAYCAKYEVRWELVVAVIAAESRFNPNARSYKGATGLGQLMPATAAAHGVDPYDPVQNLHVAIRIIRRNLDKYGGEPLKALAAYNAGTGAVKKYGGVPPYRETRNYLWRIYEYYCWLRGETPEKRPR